MKKIYLWLLTAWILCVILTANLIFVPMSIIFIYVYYILLAVYLYEFHKMFSPMYTKKLSLVISHVMMFGLSSFVLYQYYDNYIMYCLMWGEFAPAFMCTAGIGALIAFGGIFIHLRAYLYPKYR